MTETFKCNPIISLKQLIYTFDDDQVYKLTDDTVLYHIAEDTFTGQALREWSNPLMSLSATFKFGGYKYGYERFFNYAKVTIEKVEDGIIYLRRI